MNVSPITRPGAVDLTTPQAVMDRLAEIENDLAIRQNIFEDAALDWYRAKRDKEKARAVAFLSAEGTVAERSAIADEQTALDGKQEEALYESIKAVIRTLETRASIGQSLLRAQGRA
jgi:hypothetical protein